MKNVLDWKNTELDGNPDGGIMVLACCEGISNYVLAVWYYDSWRIQSFDKDSFDDLGRIKLWAYLPHREDKNYKYARETFQIRYKKNGLWEDVPHKEITSHSNAIKAMEQLSNSIAFDGVELMIEKKYTLKSELEFKFYRDYGR